MSNIEKNAAGLNKEIGDIQNIQYTITRYLYSGLSLRMTKH